MCLYNKQTLLLTSVVPSAVDLTCFLKIVKKTESVIITYSCILHIRLVKKEPTVLPGAIKVGVKLNRKPWSFPMAKKVEFFNNLLPMPSCYGNAIQHG